MFAIDKRFGMMILLLGIIEYNCSVSAVEVCMCVCVLCMELMECGPNMADNLWLG